MRNNYLSMMLFLAAGGLLLTGCGQTSTFAAAPKSRLVLPDVPGNAGIMPMVATTATTTEAAIPTVTQTTTEVATVTTETTTSIPQTSTEVTPVPAPTLTAIEVTPGAATVSSGLSQAFVATGKYSDGSTKDLTSVVDWSAAGTKVAKVDATKPGVVDALSVGTSTVSAAMDAIQGSATLTVTAASLVAISITDVTTSVGVPVAVKATGKYTDGTSADITSQVTWSTAAPAIATISNIAGSVGQLTPVAAGTTTISAALHGITGTGHAVIKAAQAFALSCTEFSQAATSTIKITNAADPVSAVLTGHICPVASGSLTVLFIMDWSGSMATSDPLLNGSCGRLQAAQAITNYLKANAGPGITVREGLIPFASTVNDQSIIAATDGNTFASQLTAERVCNNSGGTNYIAPLQAAKQMLTGTTGRVVVYFITDGAPNIDANKATRPDDDPTVVQQSVDAAQQLTSAVPGVIFNAMLLGSGGALAQNTMTRITGDASRVKLVANATDLAKTILQFPQPVLVPTSASAVLTSGATSQAVKIVSVSQNAQQTGDWIFQTAPFKLNGVAGATTANTLKVTVKDSESGTETATAVFQLTLP